MPDDDDAQEMPAWLAEMRQRELDQFKIGDRIVVTLGECPVGDRHGEQERGVRGVVLSTTASENRSNPSPENHSIWVMFDTPLPVIGRSWFYAPGELRPFDIMAEIQRIALTSESPPRDGE